MLFIKPYIPLTQTYLHQTLSEREDRERALRERKLKRALQKEQQREVKYLARQIPVWLAKMGHAYWYKKSEKDAFKGHFNPVRLDRAEIGEDAYYFLINTRRLPRGVFISHLRHPDTIETLSKAAGSAVRFHDEATGCWYSVETAYGRGGIPTFVGYAELLKMMPDDAPPLSFPLGMGDNQKPFFGDMEKLVNLLVGGTKGGGKSNAVNVLLCTILPRNSPRNLRVFLTDLKGGIEFADYNGIPHLGGDVYYTEADSGAIKTYPKDTKKTREDLQPPLGSAILTEPQDVVPMLKYVEAELDRRAKMLAGRAKKISVFNKRFPDKAISYWFVVIDELATLMENSKYKKKATESLSEIARKGRAVGIFLIQATQTPSSAIVPQQIANNMDARLAFRTGSGVASGILLGSGEYDAEKLPNIPGRFIFKWGGEKIQLQAPFIADSTVNSTIANLRAGKYVDARDAELAQKADYIFRFALAKLGGECQTNRLYSFVKSDGIKKSEVATILDQYELREGNTPEITIGDNVYYLVTHMQAKRIPRWLVPVSDVLAGKHPHPDFDYSLVSRFPFSENGQKTVLTESPNPAESIAQNGKSPADTITNNGAAASPDTTVLAAAAGDAPEERDEFETTPEESELPAWLEQL